MSVSGMTYSNSKATRLSKQMQADIGSGRFTAGGLLPTENHLAQEYKVSRRTIRRAVEMLTEKSVLQKLPNRGVLVPATETGFGSEGVSAAATERKRSIAAIWAAEPDTLIVEVRKGIMEYAAGAGIDFKIFLSSTGHDEALDALKNVRQSQVDGVIVLPYAHEEYISALEVMAGEKFPLVCLDRRVGNVPASSVQGDCGGGMYEATHYLIEKYRRPVFYLSHAMDNSAVLDNYGGYKRAMIDLGYAKVVEEHTCVANISDRDPSYWPMDKKHLAVMPVAEKLLKQVQLPVSIACVNDYVAHGVYELAGELGLTVGKDIHLVGFGDMPLSKLLKPGLTTIGRNIKSMGYESAKLLHQLIKKEVEPPVHIHLPVELIVRGSA
jgi:DNA-binding LacI/PurR family transcriptional regulator